MNPTPFTRKRVPGSTVERIAELEAAMEYLAHTMAQLVINVAKEQPKGDDDVSV